jgi:hypothetical protein
LICTFGTYHIEGDAPYYKNTKEQEFMARDIALKERWDLLVERLSAQFSDGDPLELDAIIYLVGVQELGQYHKSYKKDEKINLMHIAICRLLEPYGYYEFDYFDEEGWPHYTTKEQLPVLKAGEQSVLMKEALVSYFIEKEYIQ